MSAEPMVVLSPCANFDDQVNGIYAAISAASDRGTVTLLTDDGKSVAAIVPANRCSACNRASRQMRDRGDGVLWCGRTNCLEAVRELRGTAPVARGGAMTIKRDGSVVLDGEIIGRVYGEPRNWQFDLADYREPVGRLRGSHRWHSKREAAEMCAEAHRTTPPRPVRN